MLIVSEDSFIAQIVSGEYNRVLVARSDHELSENEHLPKVNHLELGLSNIIASGTGAYDLCRLVMEKVMWYVRDNLQLSNVEVMTCTLICLYHGGSGKAMIFDKPRIPRHRLSILINYKKLHNTTTPT